MANTSLPTVKSVSGICYAFNAYKYCSALFSTLSRFLVKIWYKGLLYENRKLPLENTYYILKFYIERRSFRLKYRNFTSKGHSIKSEVPHGSVLGSLLYLLYVLHMPVKIICFCLRLRLTRRSLAHLKTLGMAPDPWNSISKS